MKGTSEQWQAVRDMPAGPEHMAALDALLRLPRRQWQPVLPEHDPSRQGSPSLTPEALAGRSGTRVAQARRPIRMSVRIALSRPVVARQRRQAVMAAARAREAARRQERDRALEAVSDFLTAGQGQGQGRQPATLLEALEARYGSLRQARREAAALMALPPSGRALDPGYEQGTAVNGSETLAAERWQGTSAKRLAAIHPAAPWQCRTIRTVPLGKDTPLGNVRIAGSYPAGREAAAALDRGATWQPFTPKDAKPKGKGKRQRGEASPLTRRAAALRAAAGTIRMGEQD